MSKFHEAGAVRGFSLIELSIVLVILGLLTGGILAGQSLIRAAELRAVISEYQRYSAAVHSFRDRYMALPGDFRNATRFWKWQSGTGCTNNSSATTDTTNGTCDGDGNGMINPGTGGSQSGELFQFWRQLALAGLIEGTYTGLAGSVGTYHAIIGENSPPSHLSNAGWAIHHFSSGGGGLFDLNYGNTLYLGAATNTNLMSGNILRPEELWNIDTKLDDGKPARGKVIARPATSCTNAIDTNDLDASYQLTTSSITCAMLIMQQF